MSGSGLSGSSTEEYDPFDAFDRAMGADSGVRPYEELRQWRAEGPVVVQTMPGVDSESSDVLVAVRYDAVEEILRDDGRFTSSGYSEVMGPLMGRTILEMDEPEHRTYRGLIQKAFTRKAMDRWEGELVRPLLHRYVDRFAADGSVDLVRNLTFPFPVAVIGALLGLPEADHEQFHRWAVQLIGVTADYDKATEASDSLGRYLGRVVQARRDHPGEDMISVLAHGEHDGERLTDEEIIAFCRLLLPAGAETTYRSSSNLLVGLLGRPDQLDEVRADHSLIPTAIEEGIRWEPPLLGILRTAAVDTEVGGVPIPAGRMISVNVGSANHDETRWSDPDTFDLHREAKPHIGFASGPHMCLGMHLARMETRALLEVLFERLPGMRLDPSRPAPEIVGTMFRAPRRLDVVWDT